MLVYKRNSLRDSLFFVICLLFTKVPIFYDFYSLIIIFKNPLTHKINLIKAGKIVIFHKDFIEFLSNRLI